MQLFTCPKCGHEQTINVDPTLTTKDITCSACNNTVQIVVSNRCRLAGSTLAWADPLQVLEFFLDNRPTLVLTKDYKEGYIKINTQPLNVRQFTQLLKGVQTDEKEA